MNKTSAFECRESQSFPDVHSKPGLLEHTCFIPTSVGEVMSTFVGFGNKKLSTSTVLQQVLTSPELWLGQM